jgi:hypothetical protein
MASGTVPVLDWSVRIRIGCQQFLHVSEFEFLILILDLLVVALQTDIESVGEQESGLLRRVGVVTVHTGRIFRDRGMLDGGCLEIFGDILVAFFAKSGDGGFEEVLLLGLMRRMAIQAIRCSGVVPESGICESRAQIVMTIQTHLWTRNTQHSGDLPAVRIVAGSTGTGSGGPMDEATVELIFFVALEAKRFR